MNDYIKQLKNKFEIIRQNALANPYLYASAYTQKNKKDAYIEYLEVKLTQYKRALQNV